RGNGTHAPARRARRRGVPAVRDRGDQDRTLRPRTGQGARVIEVDNLFPEFDWYADLAARSPGWPALRAAWIERNPTCRCCGRRENLNVHHVRPFHLFPE